MGVPHRSRTPEHKQALPGPDDTLRMVLDNGITVLVRQNFASPAVVVQGYLEAGAQDEPSGMHGLAGFTADVMQRGTARRSFDDLYGEVESIGAGFGLSTGTHIVSFGAKGLAEDLANSASSPTLLDILSDVLRHPSFEARQTEKARTEILTALQEREQETRSIAQMKFYEMAYPEAHPYHWSQLGYPETIAPITREDLVAFHETYFAPQGMVIVVVGGVKAEDAAQAVAEAFGDWDKRRPERAPLIEVPRLDRRIEQRVSLEDKSQTNVVLGWPGPARSHPDFVPCLVGNNILGLFGMYGRLGLSIREQNGLAYYVYSRLSGGSGPGPWRVLAGFDPANVDHGIQLIIDELRRFVETPVTEEELADTASYLTGSLPLYLETNEGVARSLLNIERNKLGMDYLQRYATIIRSVTAEQINSASRRWIDPDHYALAIAEPLTETETG